MSTINIKQKKEYNYIINSTTHKKEKKKNVGTEDTCVNLYRVTTEDTPVNQIELVEKNYEIYKSIFTFKEDVLKGRSRVCRS